MEGASAPPPQLQLLDLDDDALVAVIQALERDAKRQRLCGVLGCVASLATTSKRLCRLARSAAVPWLWFDLDQHAGRACWQASHALNPRVQPLPYLNLSSAEVQAALLTMRGANQFPGCDEFTVVSQWCPSPHGNDEGCYGTPSDEMGYECGDEDEDEAEELYREQRLERFKRIRQQETLFAWSALPDVLRAAVRQCPHLTKLDITILNAPWLTPRNLGLDLAACDIGLAQALVTLQPADDLRQLTIQTPWFGPLGMEAVSRLTALTRLHINDDISPIMDNETSLSAVERDNMRHGQAAPPQDLSPLRALTGLQHLAISNARGRLVAPPAPGTLGGYPSNLCELELEILSKGRDYPTAGGEVLRALVSHLGSVGSSLRALTLRARTAEQLGEVMPTVTQLVPGLTSLVWSVEYYPPLLNPCSAWTGLTALRVLGSPTLSKFCVLELTAPQHFELLAQLPRLEVLRGADVRCAPPPHLRLASLTSLTAQCSGTGPQLATLLCCCPRLEQLHCGLWCPPEPAFALSEQRPQQSAGMAAPKRLVSCTVTNRVPLEYYLNLPGLAAVFEGVAPALQHVQSLDVTWSTFTWHPGCSDPCLPSLAALTSLTSLTLRSDRNRDCTIRHVVAMVRGCPGPLRQLHLVKAGVLTPQLVQDLQDACPHLQFLGLRECWEEEQGDRNKLLQALRRQARPGLAVNVTA